MKKSKILVPALGLLALSTVASVTGTVAWFTASAKVNVSFTEFKIERLTENLLVSSANIMGVTVDSAGAIIPTTYGTTYASLTHASVNLGTNNTKSEVWSKSSTNVTELKSGASEERFDNFVEGNEDMVAKWEDPDTKTKIKTLYALAWSSTFSYNADKKMNLYFDVKSSFEGSSTDNTRTGRGFRLAMVREDGSYVVWSPAQAQLMCYQDGSYPKEGDADIKKASCYVTGKTTTEAYDATVNGNLIYENDATVDTIDSSDKGSTARKDCLGSFSTSVDEITIKFIAWFEGEDPNVVDSGTLESVKADLGFYIRESSN